MGKIYNFFRFGLLVDNEALEDYYGIKKKIKIKKTPLPDHLKPEEEYAYKFEGENEELQLEKEDIRAIIIAAFQVFSPIILVLIILAVIAFYFTR